MYPETPHPPEEPTTTSPSRWRYALEFAVEMIKATIFAFAFIYFVMQGSIVEGVSMEPTLVTDQRLLIDKVSYGFFEPKRGDIVVIDLPNEEKTLIKRVIGLDGETISIVNGTVQVDGVPLDEPYLTNQAMRDFGPVTVPSEHVFVMGDNRPSSHDSRAFGPVDVYRIIGQARLTVWPPADIGLVE